MYSVTITRWIACRVIVKSGTSLEREIRRRRDITLGEVRRVRSLLWSRKTEIGGVNMYERNWE